MRKMTTQEAWWVIENKMEDAMEEVERLKEMAASLELDLFSARQRAEKAEAELAAARRKMNTKLCPYRREDSVRVTKGGGITGVAGERWVEMFAPCLQEKCAMWLWEDSVENDGTRVGHCGLVGKQ